MGKTITLEAVGGRYLPPDVPDEGDGSAPTDHE